MPITASLSLDLDNLWSYLRSAGREEWGSYPTYLPTLVPRVLDILERRELTITFFVVGRDLEKHEDREAIASIVEARHEIGNHTMNHYPWLGSLPIEDKREEIQSGEERIAELSGRRPRGFRGPGYVFDQEILRILGEREYLYDGSVFPTHLGPVLRAVYFLRSGLRKRDQKGRDAIFGKAGLGFLPLRPFKWKDPTEGWELLEIPVTTFPILRLPFHMSYVIWLAGKSKLLAKLYLRSALSLAVHLRVEVSILLHPLDFAGGDDYPELGFFPAMNMPTAKKIALFEWCLDEIQARFRPVTMEEHALATLESEGLRCRAPA